MKETKYSNRLSFEIRQFSGPTAAKDLNLVEGVSYIFNESFGLRPDNGRSYRLGPKLTTSKLGNTDLLFLVGNAGSEFGYLFGKEIAYSGGRIAWIESLAVLPLYRRRGIATALVKRFMVDMQTSHWIGCATPNPIAAYILTRAAQGNAYIGSCQPPRKIREMLGEIKSRCIDLRGCEIDPVNLLVKTGFSPQSPYDHRCWKPKNSDQVEPDWWKAIQNLPSEKESLVIVERKTSNIHSNSIRKTLLTENVNHARNSTTPSTIKPLSPDITSDGPAGIIQV